MKIVIIIAFKKDVLVIRINIMELFLFFVLLFIFVVFSLRPVDLEKKYKDNYKHEIEEIIKKRRL